MVSCKTAPLIASVVHNNPATCKGPFKSFHNSVARPRKKIIFPSAFVPVLRHDVKIFFCVIVEDPLVKGNRK